MNRNSLITVLAFVVSCFIGIQIGCSSDETNPSNPAAGGTGASAGQGGDSGASGQGGDAGSSGQGGTSGSSGQSGTGGTENSWKKGVIGKATKGAITLAANAGRIQGFSVTPGLVMKTMAGDAGFDDADTDADTADSGSTPNTAPVADFSGITADFTEMYIPVLPYTSDDGTKKFPPLTAVYRPGSTVETIQHFADWDSNSELAIQCFGAFQVNVNGQPLRTYGGLSMDIADCLNRHFMVSNASNKVWELLPNGEKTILAEGFETSISTVTCHPNGYLLITTLPAYDDSGTITVAKGVTIQKITLDGVVTQIAELPVTPDYAKTEKFSLCGQYPFTTYALPTGMRIPLAFRPDGSYMIADMGAHTIYTVSADGTTIETFSEMNHMYMWTILAPNDVIYTIEPPILDEYLNIVHVGTKLSALNQSSWEEIIELPDYDSYAKNMSWQYLSTPCPHNDTLVCYQPFGVFFKVMYGANGTLYLVDPIKGILSAIPLDMTEPDAGVPDAGDPDADTDAALDAGADVSEDASADASVE